jgi:hypothetical protein
MAVFEVILLTKSAFRTTSAGIPAPGEAAPKGKGILIFPRLDSRFTEDATRVNKAVFDA